MHSIIKTLLLLISLIIGTSYGAAKPLIELSDAAKNWIVHEGHPLYYTSEKTSYSVDSQTLSSMSNFSSRAAISLSPNADYRLVSILQELDQVKDEQRYSDYFVLNNSNELVYKASRGTGADLKPHVAAISDQGVLALADPVRAQLYLYEAGSLTTEVQLYEDEGDYSLERKIHVQWVGDQCYILLERPGRDGSPAGKVLFIRINADGRGQITKVLPFTYLQTYVFQQNRFFISGYNYSAQDQQMKPLIIETTSHGGVLWTNENFGHELSMSSNGDYLAARSSHGSIQLFNLKQQQVSEIQFDHENKASLGLTVNDQGEPAVLRVPLDFFVKRTTHFAQVYFPITKRSTDIQLDPRKHKLFQLHSAGNRFYIGTNYEWLELSE